MRFTKEDAEIMAHFLKTKSIKRTADYFRVELERVVDLCGAKATLHTDWFCYGTDSIADQEIEPQQRLFVAVIRQYVSDVLLCWNAQQIDKMHGTKLVLSYPPDVRDAAIDFFQNDYATLKRLCSTIGLDYRAVVDRITEAMLSEVH